MIFYVILKVYEGLKRLALPFGVMICKLLIKYGFYTYDHEEPILHRKKINAATLSMSEAHTRGHIQGENVQAQAEDKDHSIE